MLLSPLYEPVHCDQACFSRHNLPPDQGPLVLTLLNLLFAAAFAFVLVSDHIQGRICECMHELFWHCDFELLSSDQNVRPMHSKSAADMNCKSCPRINDTP